MTTITWFSAAPAVAAQTGQNVGMRVVPGRREVSRRYAERYGCCRRESSAERTSGPLSGTCPCRAPRGRAASPGMASASFLAARTASISRR